jgi:hypothetical protein
VQPWAGIAFPSDVFGMNNNPYHNGERIMKNETTNNLEHPKVEVLTPEEFEAVCHALQGGLFDRVSGTPAWRDELLGEIDFATEYSDDDDECSCDLLSAQEKMDGMTDTALRHVVELVNHRYALAFYHAVSEIVNNGECVCGECMRRAELN